MDRKSSILIAFVCAAFGLSACAAHSSQIAPGASLHEIAWLADDTQVQALTTQRFVDRDALFTAAVNNGLAHGYASREALRHDLLAGEFLFKAPLLLGGQGAKAGITCHSCHVNGTGNPSFLFPAISSAPGTADTTHSFFSKSLGNQIFDPIAIPDLTMPGRVDHSIQSGEVEAFLTTIIIGEFSGATAPSTTIKPIATYVRALRLSGVSKEPAFKARALKRDMADLSLAIDQAAHRASSGEGELAALLMSSGQAQVRSIHERLVGSRHAILRDWLIERSREMGVLRQRLTARETIAQSELTALQQHLSSAPDMTDAEKDSFYNRDVLAKALSR